MSGHSIAQRNAIARALASPPSRNDALIAKLRGAAAELLPVVVEIGNVPLRLDAYVERLEAGHSARLSLSPIAASTVPAGGSIPVCIRPRDGEPWVVNAQRVEPDGDSRLFIELDGARLLDPDPDPPRGEPLERNDVLVLVVPGGLNDGVSYVFPVTGIAKDGCEIQTTTPPARGSTLEHVELVGDRRLLRRGSAQVRDVTPWYLPDNKPVFRCSLTFGPEQPDTDQPYDLVTDPARVKRLLELGSKAQAEGWFEAPGWGRGTARLVAMDGDSARFELSPMPSAPPPRAHVRIGLELLAVQHELEVRVIGRVDDTVRTSLPLILRRRRRHRRAFRAPVPEHESVTVLFTNPASGRTERHPVTGLSFYGLAFTCDSTGGAKWESLPLERAQLEWRGRTIDLGDLRLEQVCREGLDRVCKAAIDSSRVVEDPDMIALVATISHPDVSVHDGAQFDFMRGIYEEAKLFAPHMNRNLDPIVDATRKVWRQLHEGAHDTVRTLVHGSPSAPDASVTVMRAWERAWLVQHFVNVGTQRSGAAGKLQRACLDHVLLRPDGRFLVFFVKDDNHGMNSYFRRFLGTSGTPDAVTVSHVELWSDRAASTDAPREASVGELRPMGEADEAVVARGAERALGAGAASALSMRCGEFGLPLAREAFGKAGIERSRACEIVWRGSQREYALIEERSTPGLNLTWMLNATWVVPIHARGGDDHGALATALAVLRQRPPQTPTGERFLNVAPGVPASALEAAGFRREARVILYTLNRAGVHRCHEFAMLRYGEVEALTTTRHPQR